MLNGSTFSRIRSRLFGMKPHLHFQEEYGHHRLNNRRRPSAGRRCRPYEKLVRVLRYMLDESEFFLPDKTGQRPCHGKNPCFCENAGDKDLVLFYEYFDGDTGRGLGASHQTGWTALVARCIESVRIEDGKRHKQQDYEFKR